jgi:hypothetical protein
MIKKLLLNKSNVITFLLFVFSLNIIGQTSTSGAAYIWSTATSWTPNGVPTSATNVSVNNPLTLDQNLMIGSGNYTFNQDVTDQPGGFSYNLTNLDAAGSLTIASGTTTIGGVTAIGGNEIFTLTVKSGATLVLGTQGSTANNFLIGNKTNITIEQGATLIVYGNIVNSNSSGHVTVNGLLQVYGNYVTDNGNIDISGTSGQFYTTGTMSTQGSSSQVYGANNDCSSNCSGTSLDCGTGGSSYTATIAPPNQTVCSNGAIAEMTFSTNVPSPTYQWEYSLTAGGTYNLVSGATLFNYTPSSLTVTTWYRVKYTSSASGCETKYSAPIPVYVSASTYSQATAGQTVCGGGFGPISVSAFGTGLTYQWYSKNSATNSGGIPISGATSNVYTPSSASNGTKYYYCVINSSCPGSFTTAVSGAFTVNLNSAGAASSSPTPCINTLMTSITHTTTGATGIGTATGLPAGVTATWATNTITISGTPAATGVFAYTIPLTGGCGGVNATGIVTVNPNLPSSVSIAAFPIGAICAGTSVTFTATPTNGGTTPTYQWYKGAALIIGATAATYPTTTLANGDVLKVIMTSNATCAIGSPATSNAVTVTVTPLPNNISNGFSATTICTGGVPKLTFDADDTTYSMPYSITYKNDTTSLQYFVSVTSKDNFSFPPGDNPTSNTGYTLVSISNGTCTNSLISSFGDSGANLIVRPMPTAIISGTTSVCVGATSPDITFSNPQTVDSTVNYTVNGTNQTLDIDAKTSANVAAATNVAGTFVFKLVSVTYRSTPNCSNIISGSATATVTINALPTPPTIAAAQPTCSLATGTITVTAPTGMNYSIDGSTYTNTSGIFTSLAAGSYSVTAKNSSGCISAITNVTIISAAKTWNGSISSDWNTAANWAPNGVPISSNCIIIPNVPNTPIILGTNFVAFANTLTISSGGSLVVNPTNTITITDFVNVNLGGSLTFENTASLVQINDAAENININSGSITYKRYTDYVRRYDFTYWSSPVEGQTLKDLSPLTLGDKYYGFNSIGNNWVIYYNGNQAMLAGDGYLIRAPQTFDITTAAIDMSPKFNGKPNNGIITKTLAAGKLYLLGNPYPSALDADQFLFDNKAVLDGTLYFWTHNSSPSKIPGDAIYNYTADDYASYNLTGGVGTGVATPAGTDTKSIKKIPTGRIAAGQGFFASASTNGGKLIFNNSMRLDDSGNRLDNSQFFKITANAKTTNTIEKNRVWLNLTNSQGAFKQTLVGYVSNATNGYDNSFDGESFGGNNFVDFYSINEDKNLTIQGRALPFDKNDAIPIGYRSTIKGVFSIAIDQVDGLLVSQDVFIEDKSNNVIQNLKQGAYNFSTEVGTFKNRFVLRYVNTSKTLRTGTFKVIENTVLVSSTNKQIKINSSKELINKVQVFDLLGKLIYKKNDVNSNEFVITNLEMDHQLVLVKIVLQNGTIVTKKIVTKIYE